MPVNAFEWLIALRYLRAKRKNHAVSIIALISMVTIALGVAALIIVLSVMNGFQKEVRGRILSAIAHVELLSSRPGSPEAGIAPWPRWQQIMLRQPEVQAAAPFVDGQGLLSRPGVVRGVMVRGIVPEQEAGVVDIPKHMRLGAWSALKPGEFGVILGANLAGQLGVGLGDKVTLITPDANLSPAGLMPRLKMFRVVGIFRMDMYEYDAGLALIHLQDAQKLYQMEDRVSGLRLKLDDVMRAPFVAQDFNRRLPAELMARDWTQQNSNYFAAVAMEKRMMVIILTLIVVVAGFNLISSLVMTVTDKQADIAILRTIGASPRAIMRIFMIQGGIIGLSGAMLGLCGGLLIALNIETLVPAIERLLHIQFIPADVYMITKLPSEVLPSDVLSITLISLAMSLLATLYPSYQAASVQPAEALRDE